MMRRAITIANRGWMIWRIDRIAVVVVARAVAVVVIVAAVIVAAKVATEMFTVAVFIVQVFIVEVFIVEVFIVATTVEVIRTKIAIVAEAMMAAVATTVEWRTIENDRIVSLLLWHRRKKRHRLLLSNQYPTLQ